MAVSQLLAAQEGIAAEGGSPGAINAMTRLSLWQTVDGDAIRPIFDLLETAALKPACRFEPDFSNGAGAAPMHVMQLVAAVRLLVLRSWLHSEAGRADQALADSATAMRLCAFLKSEPVTASQQWRTVAGSAAISRLSQALRTKGKGTITAPALDRVDRALILLRDPSGVGFARGLDGERVFFGSWIGKGLLKGRLPTLEGTGELPRWMRLYATYAAKPLLRRDVAAFMDAMGRARSLASKAFHERQAGLAAIARSIEGRPLSASLIPRFVPLSERLAVFEAQVEMSRAAVALERFRLATKRYPGSLSELQPPKPPLQDPFDNAFRYRPTADGFVLYSVGPDGQDNGGAGGSDCVWPGTASER
ncbi:MAG: hypothetical protein FJ224_09240 [Lentisphaerae bacterium]|nr:hypothetical protein [Lentisphaerota bacterium]